MAVAIFQPNRGMCRKKAAATSLPLTDPRDKHKSLTFIQYSFTTFLLRILEPPIGTRNRKADLIQDPVHDGIDDFFY
jgi:hypothetical protein